MDTPNSKSTPSNNSSNNNKLSNLPSSDSPAFQDSPVFSYLSNLSPIQPVKTAPVAQGFPGLSSPPLIFTSPRLSFINRHLRSSTSNSECARDNDQCQKNDADLADSAKLDLCLQSPSASTDQKGYNTKKLEQVAPSSTSGCLDEFLTDPKECSNSLHKIQSDDVPQSSEVGCLEKRDYGNDGDVVRDDSTSLKITESGQAKSKISIKVVKNEPQHLISASLECSSISTKLPIGHTSELCQPGDTEASHLERGSLRRCLFDENQRMYTTNGPGSCNPNEILTRIQEVSNMSSSGTSTNNPPKPVTGMLVSPSTANYRVSISKPLGIGLHLNSVVYPRSTDSAVGGQQSSEKVVRVKGNNSVLITNRQPAGKVSASSMPSRLVGKAPGSSEEVDHKASSVATSGKPFASDAVEQFSNPNVLKPDDHSAIASDKRKRNSEITEGNEESDLASPKKKRKKSASTVDDDNCKRCNCKKTKCLKLYCDCFAAGFYCGESCSCQGCFNRPEYEDTVMETRQQIESRNPLAFAPKVVQPVTESPAISKELVNLSTPSSARHKRGCNCKKSMCLKKYCECYQSNVGCSDGCRCEGCKNVYGKREDFSIAREFLIKRIAEATPEGIDKTQEISVFSSNVLNSRAHNSPNVIPVTPALLCSDQKKNAIKSRLPFRRFLKSPESPEMLTSGDNFPTSPRKSPSHSMILEKSEAETGCANSEDKTFSSFEGPINESESISTDPPSSSKPQDSGNALQPDSYSGGGLPPLRSNLRWRSSPMTPTQVAGSEFVQDFDTGSKHSDVLEDDTPEILKDSATPVESVKVRSPNKKRVSPPHNHLNSPESLRSSRKFVLKAVCGNLDRHSLPKFPSLTPYSTNNAVTKRSEPLDP